MNSTSTKQRRASLEAIVAEKEEIVTGLEKGEKELRTQLDTKSEKLKNPLGTMTKIRVMRFISRFGMSEEYEAAQGRPKKDPLQ